MPSRRSLAAVLACVLIVAAGFHLVREVWLFHVDTPYWDGWTLGELVVAQREGTLTWGSLAAPHNEHRPVASRALLLALAAATGWDAWAGVVAVLALGCASGLAFAALVARIAGGWSCTPWWAWVALAVVWLSLNQWENWLWEWQAAVFLTLLGVAGGVALLARPVVSAPALALAAAAGVLASFSFANGLLYWLLALPLIWRHGGPRRGALLATWLLVASVVAATYFPGLSGPSLEGPRPDLAGALLGWLRYFGAPVANHLGATLAACLGAVGLAAFAITAWRVRRLPAFWPGVSMAGLSIASGALVAFGRATFLEAPTVATKYVSFGNLLWLTLIAWWAVESPRRRWASTAAMVIAAATVLTGLQARAGYALRKQELANASFALLSAENDALISRFFPGPDYLRTWLPPFREHRLAMFACDSPQVDAAWRRAAAEIAHRARDGDEVLTSTDWAASCLARHLRGAARVHIVSAGESAELVGEALAGGNGRFLVVAGDVVSHAARDVMTRAHPLWQPANGPVRVLYGPDRLTYLRERATEEEYRADERAFWSGDPVVSAAASAFLLAGWSDPESDRAGAFRWAVGTRSTLYVPVTRTPPSALTLELVPFTPRGERQHLTVTVNGTVIGSRELVAGLNVLDVDLGPAAWDYGANVLSFDCTRATMPADVWPGSGDTRALSVQFRAVHVRP